LSLQAGELKCIIGPNGCGKTTLFNIVTGAFPPTSGRIFVSGRDVTGRRANEIARLGVSRKFQVPGVYPELTVAENLEVPLAAGAGASPLSAIFQLAPRHRLDELLELCGLDEKSGQEVSTLSHGERQWLEIAMLVATDAELILLDEPTAGMSVVETQKTAGLIQRLRSDYGKTVLVIEHDMGFVSLLDCPVVVIMRGTVLREGTYEEVRQDDRVIEAYLGKGQAVC
jgi:ABC-type uncharacterized transport system ATPase subunit